MPAPNQRRIRESVFSRVFFRPFLWLLPRPTFTYVTGLTIAVFFSAAGFLFDSVKAFLWPGWRPRLLYGWGIFVIYFGCNIIVPALFALLCRIRPGFQGRILAVLNLKWPQILLGISVFSAGFLNWLILFVRDDEYALTPWVFHGGFGFLAVIVFSSISASRDHQLRWARAARIETRRAEDIRKGLEFQNQELLKNLRKTMQLWSLMVGIAMFILFVVKSRHGWNPKDPDLNTTAIQFFIGLIIGCGAIWFWGLEPALYTSRWCGKLEVGRLRPPEPIMQRIIMGNVVNIHTINVGQDKPKPPTTDPRS